VTTSVHSVNPPSRKAGDHNVFNFQLGGRIVRDKLWFFAQIDFKDLLISYRPIQ
jgi:hypothetical protein